MAKELPDDRMQRVINAINMEHLYKLRTLRGKDISEHVQDVINLEAEDRYAEMLELLEEVIDITHALEQYDQREPQPYYALKACSVYMRLGRRADAIRALERWLGAWPEERATTHTSQRKKVVTKLERMILAEI